MKIERSLEETKEGVHFKLIGTELATVKRQIDQIVRAIETGGDVGALVPRLNEFAKRRDELLASLSLARAPDVAELHPKAAASYAAKVEQVQAALSGGDAAGREAIATVRGLIQRIVVNLPPRVSRSGRKLPAT